MASSEPEVIAVRSTHLRVAPASAVVAVVAVMAVVLALAGCASGGTVSTTPAAPGSVTDGWPQPPGCPALGTARPLAADDVPTAVLVCDAQTEVVPGDGEYLVAVRKRATQGLEPVLAALRLPAPPPPAGNNGCAAYASQNWVVLEIGGAPVTIATPVDTCQHRLPEVDTALAALVWTEVSRTRGEKLRSAAAVQADCQQWKDEILLPDLKPAGPADAPVVPADDPVTKICFHRTEYPAGWTPASREVLAGVPTGGSTPDADLGTRLAALLRAATPATACSLRHTGFAVLFTAKSGFVYVEVDGCRRVMGSDYRLRQGSEELSRALRLAEVSVADPTTRVPS